MLPLFFSGTISLLLSLNNHLRTSIELQQRMADITSQQINNFFESAVFNHIQTAEFFHDLKTLDTSKINFFLSRMISYSHPAFGKMLNSVALYDCQSRSWICEALFSDCTKSDYIKRLSPIEKARLCTNEEFTGPLQFDKVDGLPFMFYLLPVIDPLTGEHHATIIAEVRIKAVWDEISSISFQNTNTVYLTDSQGVIVAHKDPSRVLQKIKFEIKGNGSVQKAPNSLLAIVTRTKIRIGSQVFFLISEQPLQYVIKPLIIQLVILTLTFFGALGIAIKSAKKAEFFVLAPLEKFSEKAQNIENGNYGTLLNLDRDDEIGVLATSFDNMSQKLKHVFGQLHKEIGMRTTYEKQLLKNKQLLENEVAQRTEKLSAANVKLEKSRKEYQELVNTMTEGLVKVDAKWDMTFANKALCKMIGFTQAQLKGKSFFEIIAAKDRDKAKKELSLRKQHVTHAYDIILEHSDGTEIATRCFPAPIFDASGNYIGGVGIISDVTKLKRIEQEKNILENQLYTAIEALDEGFVIYDENDRLVLCNEQYKKIYKTSADMLIPGNRFEDILREGVKRGQYPKADGKEEQWIARRLKQHLQPGQAIEQNIGPGRWVKINEKKIPGGGIVGFRADISELKEKEIQLSNLLRQKEMLVREVHHRVKNNLAVIISLLNLQMDSLSLKADKTVFLESQNRIKAMSLIHESLYRSDNIAQIQLESYTRSLVNNLLNIYSGIKNRVKIKIAADKILLNMDDGITCGLILNELISNAFKYAFPAGEKGTVEIAATQTNRSSIRLTVKDDGVGFPDDILLADVGTGTLGLKIVSLLAENQLDGRLNLSNNDGACIEIQWAPDVNGQ